MSLRRGSTSTPTAITKTGTERQALFAEESAPCFFSNTHTSEAYVLINSTEDATAAAGGYDWIVAVDASVDLSFGGLIAVKTVNVFWGTDPTVAYSFTGMPRVQVA